MRLKTTKTIRLGLWFVVYGWNGPPGLLSSLETILLARSATSLRTKKNIGGNRRYVGAEILVCLHCLADQTCIMPLSETLSHSYRLYNSTHYQIILRPSRWPMHRFAGESVITTLFCRDAYYTSAIGTV